MGAFGKRVEAAYASRPIRQVTVPEWELTLHIAPLTILQLKRIQAESDTFARAVRIIQVRAKNEQGLPMFDEQDFDLLCSHGVEQYGPAVVARVAGEIMADLPTAEAVEKN